MFAFGNKQRCIMCINCINMFVSCIYQVVLDSFHQQLQFMVFIFYCWTLDMYIVHNINSV